MSTGRMILADVDKSWLSANSGVLELFDGEQNWWKEAFLPLSLPHSMSYERNNYRGGGGRRRYRKD